MVDWIYQMDFGILDWIQENLRNAVTDFVFPLITFLGNKGVVWLVLAAVFLCLKKYRKVGVMMLIALTIGLVVGEVFLKEMVGRARPFMHVTQMELLIPAPERFSFPSGHSWSSFAAATVVLLHDKRLGIPAMVLAVLIAFSRLFLYVHFPSDVLVGCLCGILTGLLVVFQGRKIVERWKRLHSLQK